MKNEKKVKLSDLKFKSFVTSLDSEVSNKLKGGLLCDTEDDAHCRKHSETHYATNADCCGAQIQ
ncbi:pinensin family lanthipeptide [Cytophagaceae bacterium ABcell3]|nr:pinensin family lanthipeptide [Cytophagaceae bacterium ABcell3]